MTEQTESAPASGDAEPSSGNRKKRLSRREQKARKRQRKQQDPKDSKSNIVRGEKNGEANQPESQPKKSKKKKRKRQQKEDKSGDNNHPVKTSLPKPEHPTAPALIPPEIENEDAKPLNKRARKKLRKRQKQDEKGATDLPEDPSKNEKKQGTTEPEPVNESSTSDDEKKSGQSEAPENATVPTMSALTAAAESDNDGNTKKRLSRRAKKRQLKQQKRQQQQQEPKDNKPEEEDPKPQSGNHAQLKEQSTTKQDRPADIWKTSPLQTDIPYSPTPLPDIDKDGSSKQTKKTLGKWFPKASVVKSQPSASSDCTILLFYQYKTPVLWHERKVAQLIRYLQAVAEARPQLGGRLRVAPEGINATLSCGDAPDGTNGRTILEHFTRDLQQFDAVFHETDFKFLPAKADRHFKDLKILPVQELVFYGLQEAQAPLSETGVHLDAKDFHEMLQDTTKDTVVVDVRNHYEAALGRFDGQAKIKGAAQYTDPLMRKSTDFPSWVEKAADDLKGKRVMMYCTGGVRCERASAYLRKTMGDSLDGVYQLQGGIERYLQAYPDGGHWRGSNFVFDKREAVSANNPNGDGGVVAGKKKKRKQLESVETKCCLCDRPWDRYIGKKKCECCGVPVLMCDSCLSSSNNGAKKKKKSKTGSDTHNNQQEQDEPPKMARCPLCVAQNITVKIEDTEYTDNGVKSKSNSDQGKAAPSVLKWGGGHASQKKERRRRSREKAREEAKSLSSKA